jgi:O-antigen/teichoic acid export membrane protein
LQRWALSSGLFRRRIVRDGAWVAFGQVGSAVAALASIRIVTELISPEEFGRLTLLVGMAALALGLAANPRLQALIRYYPEARQEGRTHALRIAGFRLIWPLALLAAGVLAGGLGLSSRWIGGAWYTGILVAALFATDCLRSFELALFNAARRQRAAALVYAADAWSRPLMAMAAVSAFGSSGEAALAGYTAGSALVVIAMRAWLRCEGRGKGNEDDARRAERGEALCLAIRRYALPLAPIALFGWLSGVGDRYVIAGLLSLEDAGIYAAAYGLASRPFLMLAGVVELTMRPVLQEAAASGNIPLIGRAKRSWLLVIAAGATLGTIAFLVLSGWIADILLAPEYRAAAALMPWIALGYGLYAMAGVYTRLCYVFDDPRAVVTITAFGGIIGLLMMVLATFLAGLEGAAGSTSVSFGAQLLLSHVLALRSQRKARVLAPASAGPSDLIAVRIGRRSGSKRRRGPHHDA